MKNSPTNKRKNYFIKKEFQAKFILKFCLLIILACFLMSILVYLLSAKTVTASFENLRLVAKSTADFILPSLALSSLFVVIIVSLACIFIVLFISHRIAGPLYRFERNLEQIAKGDLTVETRLRETDEIKMLADSLNEMVKKFKGTIASSQKEINNLSAEVISIRGKLKQLGIAEEKIRDVLQPAEDQLEQLKEGLSYFKV